MSLNAVSLAVPAEGIGSGNGNFPLLEPIECRYPTATTYVAVVLWVISGQEHGPGGATSSVRGRCGSAAERGRRRDMDVEWGFIDNA